MSEYISFVNAAASFNPEGRVSGTPSPEPPQIFPLHQVHSTAYDPKPTPETETEIQPVIFCPKPIRQYPTHKVILQPKLFEDWFVDMSEPVFIDEAGRSAPSSSNQFHQKRPGPGLKHKKSSPSSLNPAGQILTMMKRMMSQLRTLSSTSILLVVA